jgi:hypothetical protein
MIPIVPGSEAVHTPDAGVQMNASALNVQSNAKFDLAQSLGSAGREIAGAVTEVSKKIQAARDYTVAADADRLMRQTSASFRESLQGRTDEDQWSEQWVDKSNKVRETIFEQNPHLSAAAKRQIDVNLKDWASAGGIEVKTLANKQIINRSQQKIGLAADEAVKDGDENGMRQLIDGGVQHRLFFPEQGEAMKRQYANRMDEYAARNFIEQSPASAAQYLGEKGKNGSYTNLTRLSPDQRDRLLTEARKKTYDYQKDSLGDLITSLDQTGVPKDRGELDKLVKAGSITGRQREAYDARVERKHQENYRDMSAVIRQEMDNHDLTEMKPDQRAEWAREMGSEIAQLDPRFSNPLNTYLKKVMGAADKEEKKKGSVVRTRLLNDAREDFEQGLFIPSQQIDNPKTHGFTAWMSSFFSHTKEPDKVTQDPERNKQWLMQSDETTIAQARGNYANWQRDFTDWLSEHPDSSYEEAHSFSSSLKEKYVQAQVKQAFAPPPSKPNVTPGEYAKLKAGDKYLWNGQELTKQ